MLRISSNLINILQTYPGRSICGAQMSKGTDGMVMSNYIALSADPVP